MMKVTNYAVGVLLALTIAACAAPRAPADIASALHTSATPAQAGQAQADAFVVQAGPCFGACPIFELTVRADGSARFQGHRFTGSDGVHVLPANPSLFADLQAVWRAHEAAFTGSDVAMGKPGCDPYFTDAPSYALSRISADGRTGASFYTGCQGPQALALRAGFTAVFDVLNAHGVPYRSAD